VQSKRGQGRGKLGVAGGERGRKKQSNLDVGPGKRSTQGGRGGTKLPASRVGAWGWSGEGKVAEETQGGLGRGEGAPGSGKSCRQQGQRLGSMMREVPQSWGVIKERGRGRVWGNCWGVSRRRGRGWEGGNLVGGCGSWRLLTEVKTMSEKRGHGRNAGAEGAGGTGEAGEGECGSGRGE